MTLKPMDVTPEIAGALAQLRLFATRPGTPEAVRRAMDALDNSEVFSVIDEHYNYADPADVLQEIAEAAVPNTADPAEWGDTTSTDMARHQGLVDDPADIAAAVRRASCTCGRPDEPSPALHAGTCPVWAQHHNLA